MKAYILEDSFLWLVKLLGMAGRGPEGRPLRQEVKSSVSSKDRWTLGLNEAGEYGVEGKEVVFKQRHRESKKSSYPLPGPEVPT